MENREYYKGVWDSISEKIQAAIVMGESFYPKIKDFLSSTTVSRAEFSSGSILLPRGFYCPSPDIECVITNLRRGKILKRLTKASKPTHYYMFNAENRLFLAETCYPNGVTETEYILHNQDASYGFAYDRNGRLTKISIEEFVDNKLCHYLWASCINTETSGYTMYWIVQEKFHYLDDEHLETDFCNVDLVSQQVHISRWKAVFDVDENKKIILSSRTHLLYEKARL